MKPEKLAALTDEQLLKQKKIIKNTHNIILATGVVAMLLAFIMFGYHIGKDAATGGQSTFYYKPLLPFVFIFIIGNVVVLSEKKSIDDEIKKRKLG
ncbi:hypothetical protein FHS57_005537 [Runella defluvii]|uniref:Uncharacterized protein n=1 Tax=Runella defluvii TaxID=370973 RepID=A0A7W5ZQZ7_9BACT|nr:hypothetical protein [Runella defluvii]MBB3841509.1 hypothetical protein [Runella defluvii]